ncbi:MAG TPA: CPBP family glutamic-type intramembrane protease [Thermoanaerobaculia bacterium]|jgi:membrane protease YdiL (CAAX protease family)
MDRLNRRDWLFIGACVALFAIALVVALTNFTRAFPEASIDFKVDRGASRVVAERVLQREHVGFAGMRNTASFDTDDSAKIFLERTLGLDRAQSVMRNDVRLWAWHHRWFKPLQEEELSVDVAPTGEVIGFGHKLPEDRAIPTPDIAAARGLAESFLVRNGIKLESLQLVSQSERNLPHRIQRIFTWDSKSIRPAGAPYRTIVTVDGNVIGSFSQHIRVPDDWQRSYRELRSKNLLAGQIDSIFLLITIIAALVVFVGRLRRRDIHLRFLLGIGIASVILVVGVALNNYPAALAGYDTATSFAAFIAQFAVSTVLQAFGTAMFLAVLAGAGEVLFRERSPQQIAIPRIWSTRALGSKRVFLAFILGYTLVAFFLAYQVIFYIVASKFGAWSPMEVPYDEMLNSALPWVAVLFAGFFPALSEEFMSRAFSLPFFERILRSRIAAIVVAGFIWGFGHATYPNQPFYIRGVEVGIAGVALGFLFFRFGLLPLLIWHFTVDAFYTALLLFRSHNAYYIVSGAAASFVFVVPMLIAIVLYLKRGGFIPDDDLTNATLPVSAAPAVLPARPKADLPPPIPVRRPIVIICVIAVILAAILVAVGPWPLDDAIDYRITKEQAKQIATAHLKRVEPNASYQRVIATTLEGFRNWNAASGREDGGSPGGFDSTAAEYMLAHGLSTKTLADIFKSRVVSATWTVRFFTPMKKEEYFVEVDPHTSRAIGFHKYLDEKLPGATLDQAHALAIALPSFAQHGVDASAFELKEALSFQQPIRRDWLFHFQEKRPLVADAYRRETVRVDGAEVTQFTTTVHVPEGVYRAATQETLRNVVLSVLRVGGGIALLALIVTGVVAASMRHRPNWMRALRWTLALAIVPVIGIAADYESSQFGYSTSVKWDTFITGYAVDILRDLGIRLGGLFLALVAIDAAVPHALDSLTREARARFGRSALVAAIASLASFAAVRALLHLIEAQFPAAVNVSLDIPSAVAIRFPAIITIGEAFFDAVIASGVVAAFAYSVSSFRKMPWLRDAITIAVIFCASMRPDATFVQTPLMLIRGAVLAFLTWFIARFVLDGNVLAWPLAVFMAVMLNGIDAMGQHRLDLHVNMAVVAVALVAMTIWIAYPKPYRFADDEPRNP